jgi:hypothetical protein
MGVHKLWDVLSGAGRTAKLESLQHRTLAIGKKHIGEY